MLSERPSYSEVIDHMNSKFTHYNIYLNLSVFIDCLLSTLSIKIELIQTYLYLWFLLGAQVYAT